MSVIGGSGGPRTQSDFLANGFFPSSAISLPNFFATTSLCSGRNAGKVSRSTAKATPGAGWMVFIWKRVD
jgi:hypothetical protein